jgi:hypothetical protein
MSKDNQPKPVKHTHFMRGVFIEATLLVGVFLLGFIPMWLKARDAASRLSEAERHLSMASVQTAMASAAMDAR